MKTITVLGCGIVGLTAAIKLQEKGFQVTLIAKDRFDKTLSSKVGAIWFPFEIQPRMKAYKWAALGYKAYQLDLKEGNGVAFIPFITAYDENSNTDWVAQLPEGTVRKALPEEVPTGIKHAFISTVPLVEPLLYLPYLFERFIANGGAFKSQKLDSLLEVADLDTLVVNCTGLGAKELCHDADLQAMRGQILRCQKMDIPSCADSTKKGALSYVINRSEDCVIGGTDYENDWNTQVEKSDTQLITQRLMTLGLSQEAPKIIEEIVGLRPKRSAVRFEFDETYPTIFHNYGHGGAGFTVAWGCATELTEIISEIPNNI
jgi:D-amino-acid oxidase